MRLPAVVTFLALVWAFPGPSWGSGWSPPTGIVLHGNLVTMADINDVRMDHWMFIQNEKIVGIEATRQELEAKFPEASNAALVETNGGWIYPGMLNIHNHMAFNFLPLYKTPRDDPARTYDGNPANCPNTVPFYWNRHQWNSGKAYEQYVRYPKDIVGLTKYLGLQTETLKWAEVKALAGGETSVQGTPPNVALSKILVRNVEALNFGDDRIFQKVLDINGSQYRTVDAPNILGKMDEGLVDAYFLHVGEGRWDDECEFTSGGVVKRRRDEFQHLKELGLTRQETVIVHGGALNESEYAEMGAAGMKMVWSPLSNLLLYRVTSRIYLALKHGVMISLGTDWSPSGSKNLLDELKIADQVIKFIFPYHPAYQDTWQQDDYQQYFSDYELVKMVTVNPAATIKWSDKVGTLEVGKFADLFVIRPPEATAAPWENDGNSRNDPIFEAYWSGQPGFNTSVFNPYRRLINASVAEVELVMVGGDPLYGDIGHLKALKPGDYELVCSNLGFSKAVDITKLRTEYTSGTTIRDGDQTFASVVQALQEAMRFDTEYMRLRFRDSVEGAMSAEEFRTYLDTKFNYGIPGNDPTLSPLRLDPLFVTDDLIKSPSDLYNWFDLVRGSHTIDATYPDASPAPNVEGAYYAGLSVVLPEGAISDGDLLTFVNTASESALVGDVGIRAGSSDLQAILDGQGQNGGFGSRDQLLSTVSACTVAMIENYLLSQMEPRPPEEDGGAATPDAGTPVPDGGTPDAGVPDAAVQQLLNYLNHESTTVDSLDLSPPGGPGLTPAQAEATIAHRNGPDGIYGTPDDNPFNTEEEVDSISGIGPATLQDLKDFAATWTPAQTQDILVVFLNDPTTTLTRLDDEVKLSSTAARNLISHRDGPDGVFGTADDNLFDTVAEVDGVPYIGPAALQAIRDWIAANSWQPPIPLDQHSRLLAFINHASTNFDLLYSVIGLSSRASSNIVGHRDGPDQQPGTSDDDPFDTVGELDDIPYVGTASMDKLYAYSATWTGGSGPPTPPAVVTFVNAATEADLVAAITTCNSNISTTTATSTAQNIIAARQAQPDGMFQTVNEIDAVGGVGPATLTALTQYAENGASCGG